MRAGDGALQLIKDFEGFREKAYLCPAGKLTIGYGTTGPEVKPNMVITKEQAEALLRNELRRVEFHINSVVQVPLTQNQFDALASFVYNVGPAAFGTSTLLKHLNQGNYAEVPSELSRWNKARGKELPGLTRRRATEAALWSKA